MPSPDPFRLDNRTALVTGSNRGIGLALAGALARAGAHVVVNGRDEAATGRAAGELRGEGLSADAASFDVADPAAVERAIERIEAAGRPLDILVNNAGMQHRAPIEDFPADAFRRVLDLNLHSAFFVAQAAVRRMAPRGRGSIINICSVQSELGRPGIVPYTMAKGGLRMMTRGMAAELGTRGIRVNGLAPGYFRTEMNAALTADPEFTRWVERRTPMGRWGDVAELGGAAVFLASDAASFVTGQILYVDGGMTSAV